MAMEHYCHNCKHWSQLPDGTFCGHCLSAYVRLGRLPKATDPIPPVPTAANPRPTIARLWAELDSQR